MKQKIVFIVPEGLVNWSSIVAVSEILHWADCHWQGLGYKSRLHMQMAHTGIFQKTQPLLYPALPQVHLSSVRQPGLIIIPSLSQQYEAIVANSSQVISWINRQYKNGAAVASICTGAFLLAATGLVDGKLCATHWDAAEDFSRMFPKVNVSLNVLTTENRVYTNGGGYSFLNLALFLVEQYFDRGTAILCSKMFQIDMGRHTQSPFAVFEGQKLHGDVEILQAQAYIEKHFSDKISLEKLAQSLAVSRRNFDRRFIKATANTPGEYIQRIRVEYAKTALEKAGCNVTKTMLDCGYTDEKAFREVFRKLAGLSPIDYKIRYQQTRTKQPG